MKLTVSSKNLFEKLKLLSGVISGNPILPILGDFLFDLDGEVLTISSTDLDTSITTSIDVISESHGKIAVPSKILLDTLKALPEHPITFNIDSESFVITITSAYGSYKLSGENPDDFPKIK